MPNSHQTTYPFPFCFKPMTTTVPNLALSGSFHPFPDQQNALNLMLSGVPLMRLHGNAGSGKTTLITNGLLPQLEGKRVAVSAFTHRACGVVRTKILDDSTEVITSSALLGFKPAKSNSEGVTEFVRNASKSRLNEFDLIVFDEASMLPQEHIDAILEDQDRWPHVQVILVGDDAQLPPVNAEGNIAPAFVLDIPEHGLEEVRRNAGAILDYATVVRSNEPGLKLKVTEHIEATGSVFLTGTRERTLERIKQLVDRERDELLEDSFIVLGYTNKQVKWWNDQIRRYRYGKDANPFVEGELLVSKSIIYTHGEEHMNDPLPIAASSSELKILTAEAHKYVSKDPVLAAMLDGGAGCWKLTAECDQAGGVITLLAVDPKDWADYEKTVSQLFAKGREVKKNADKKVDWTKGEDSPFTARQWFMAGWTMKRVFGHDVQPRFARTIHKSQGGEWNDVFLDVSDMVNLKRRNAKEYRSLLYTGMTRAAQNLHLTRPDI
jgi:hypothetical protein